MSTDAGVPTRQPRILMCPPDYYGIEYEINPWMRRGEPADHAGAVRQWEALHNILVAAGAEVRRQPPVAGLPDLVFTANAGLVFQHQAVVSRFRHPERQGEEIHDRNWFAAAGFEVLEPPPGMAFEGAGDALFCGDTLFAGYRIRSDARGHQQIGELLGCRVLPLELVSAQFYHLDTCFCPLAPGVAAWYPPAFDSYARRTVAEWIPERIEVESAEAEAFACNAVVVGRTVVTNVGCPNFHRALERRGFHPIATPLSEFLKSGGSAKCLTLRLDGEDAAGWAASPAP